jgi:hypothetical protein
MQFQQGVSGSARRARGVVLLAGMAGALLLAGCRHHRHGVVLASSAAAGADADALRFHLAQAEARPGEGGALRSWTASYDAGGKTAKFRIELALRPPEGSAPISFTSGAFAREAGSDPTVFLRDLARVLEAKAKPKPGRRLDRLPFTAALLEVPSGEGAGAKVGRIATKVFVAEGAGEFYLNLDPAAGVGEITMKDPDYGDTVVRELARVL